MTAATKMTNHPNRSKTNYVVVDAPGYYGDRTLIMSAHRTLEAPLKAAKPTAHCKFAVYECALKKGATWYRAAEGSFRRVA